MLTNPSIRQDCQGLTSDACGQSHTFIVRLDNENQQIAFLNNRVKIVIFIRQIM